MLSIKYTTPNIIIIIIHIYILEPCRYGYTSTKMTLLLHIHTVIVLHKTLLLRELSDTKIYVAYTISHICTQTHTHTKSYKMPDMKFQEMENGYLQNVRIKTAEKY